MIERLKAMTENWMWTEKYRPKTLAEITGQKPIIERLKGFLSEQELPHLLFAGPAGTGKTTAILAFAHELYGEQFQGNFIELNASVVPETPIMIRENGKIKRTNFEELAKIYFTDKEKYATPTDLEVLSIDDQYQIKFMPVSLISRHRVDKIAKIKYEGGEVSTSLNHSVVILDDQGNLSSVAVSELKEGDLLITFKTTFDGEEQLLLNFEQYSPQLFNRLAGGLVKNPKVKHIFENLVIDNDLAEGCLTFSSNTSGGLIFTFGYPAEMDSVHRVGKIVKSKFGIESTTKLHGSGFDRSRKSSIQLRFFNTQLARFFRANFYNGSKTYTAKHKKVPSFIFDCQFKKDFLKGYMHDGTGDWRKFVRISSSSKEALIDISWLGRISGLETSCFDRETRIVWKLPQFSYIRTRLLPAAPLINLFKKNTKKIDFNWRYILRHQLYSKRSKRVSKKTIKELLSMVEGKIDQQELDKLMKLVSSPISTVLIRKIKFEEYNDFVYDVSVPGSEMFWGGTAPILLHNSDQRGIDVIRNRVKDFARTRPLGNVPFKIISLDEADNLTRDAQHALRRTMERYVTTCRFCLICNYSSRIIEPIQSRCALFRFPRLEEKDVIERLKFISKAEEIVLSKEGLDAILYVSAGDLRKAINVLQAASVMQKKVDADSVFLTTGKARPEEVRQMIHLALEGKFLQAQEKLLNLLIWQGLSGTDVIRQIHREVLNLGINEQLKIRLVDMVGETEFRLTEGADPEIQLSYVLAQIALSGKKEIKPSDQ
jgi:replication factor C small subunit